MDNRSGLIVTPEEMRRLEELEFGKRMLDLSEVGEDFEKRFKKVGLPKEEDLVEMKVEPTKKQLKRMKIGRNDKCPCGSGVKFKKCCLVKKNK